MSLYKEIVEIEARGEIAALCTVVCTSGSTPRRVGSKMLVYPEGHISGTVGGGEMEMRVVEEALEAMEEGKPRLVKYSMTDPKRGDPGVCGGQLEVYVDPILPQATVVVIGAGHVGIAVAHLAHWLGFRVIVSDDREGFAAPEQTPEANDFHHGPVSSLPETFELHKQTYVVMTTRSVDLDVEGLPSILETQAAYVGVIGSKRRWQNTRKQLLKKDIPEEKINFVVSPMGLELNAETPEEIAVSIMAEIIMLRQGGEGGRMGAAAL